MFLSPALILRKKLIVEKLKKMEAISEATAKTLDEAGIFHPGAFPKLTQNMVDEGILGMMLNKKYYVKK